MKMDLMLNCRIQFLLSFQEERRQSLLSRDSTMTTVTRVVNIDPCATSIDACKQLLHQNQSDDLLVALDNEDVWALLRDENSYHEGFTVFARYVRLYESPYLGIA